MSGEVKNIAEDVMTTQINRQKKFMQNGYTSYTILAITSECLCDKHLSWMSIYGASVSLLKC